MSIPGPPYPPWTAVIGGLPTLKTDIPICTIFAILYSIAGLSHFGIFITNLRHHHVFIPSNAIAGFCLVRFITNLLRMVSVKYRTNISLALTAQIFLAAGVVVLYIINLAFVQRVLRARYPKLGWSRFLKWGFRGVYVVVVLSIFLVITAIVQSFYTLDSRVRQIDRDIQLYGATYFMIVSFLPFPILLYISTTTILIPRLKPLKGKEVKIDNFGTGSFTSKLLIIFTSTCLLCLSASFRAGTLWMKPRPFFNPAWYYQKPAFYCFYFVVEIILVYFLLVVRVDKRFYVSGGCEKVKRYQGVEEGEGGSCSESGETGTTTTVTVTVGNRDEELGLGLSEQGEVEVEKADEEQEEGKKPQDGHVVEVQVQRA